MAAECSNLDEVIAPPPVENRGLETVRERHSIQNENCYKHNSPDEYTNLDEVAVPPFGEGKSRRLDTLEDARSREVQDGLSRGPLGPKRDGWRSATRADGEEMEEYKNLDELAVPSPIENPYERQTYRHHDLEEVRSEQQQRHSQNNNEEANRPSAQRATSSSASQSLAYLTHLYVSSYLILFSMLGVLARLGLQALTVYPDAPITFVQLWANFAGSLIMGYLSEDRIFFRHEWATAQKKAREADEAERVSNSITTNGSNSNNDGTLLLVAKKEHTAAKKKIPLFIGLAVGFCGSLTSFSSFMRDTFLVLSNSLGTFEYTEIGAEVGQIYGRNAGDSVMAVLAVLLVEISVCIAALDIGAHLAIGLESFLPSSLPNMNFRRVIDPLIVILAWLFWLGAVSMAIWPPDRPNGPAATGNSTWAEETWRGQAIFALVFAPLGCLTRFHISLKLNGLLARFPLGTFVVNVVGTLILGMCWDLQHAPLSMAAIGGGRVGCQVLQGMQDGFCGCLTTVSTWVLELKGLRREHAYIYGGLSVGVSISILVVVMGSLIWTHGILDVACVT